MRLRERLDTRSLQVAVEHHGRKVTLFEKALYLCFFCVFVAPVSASARPYVRIEGKIETVSYLAAAPGRSARAARRNIRFVCIAGTNQWRIDNDFADGAEVKWWFDGTNVYNAIHPIKPPSSDMTSKAAKFGLAMAPFQVAKSNLTVTIRTSPFGLPLGNVGVNIPWLAFCSGTYLKQRDRIIPVPVATLANAPDGFGYSDKTQTFEDALALPRTVDLFTSRSLYVKSVTNFAEKELHRKIDVNPQAFRDGILKFHYVVLEWTNFMGWTLPVKFEYLQYEPGENGDFVARYGGTGEVASVRASGIPGTVFDPSLQQTIVDYRFGDARKSVSSITYTSAQSFALPTNTPELQNKLARVRLRAAQSRSSDRRVRFVVITLLFVASASPVAAMVCRRIRQHRST